MHRQLKVAFWCLGIPALCVWGLAQRFYIGFDPQQPSCLFTHWYLVDTWDKDIARGNLMAYEMLRADTKIPQGTRLVKVVRAVSGDTVDIDRYSITVNKSKPIPLFFGELPIIVEQAPEELERRLTVPASEVFLSGTTRFSYDSRFWGTVSTDAIIGRAYALF
ncbi:S26 family signal peptidase [Neiella sp. HB171785]|uniref:S26 family signal peptidase n=1 Tax=Neiella litorisoli TaxID=2771431 RepID=A0A8J6UFZ8_9GAMM|nr:S26 family signal peptidase [Neiella litorisoli]MBD1389386.1 S26 family signal peptidase [Neiella litorisoli]